MDSPAQSTEDTVADAFGVLSAAITAIDPALLTRSPMPQSPAPTPFSIYPNPLPDFQSAQPIITSPKPISFNDPFAQRALSEPPEQPHSTHPYPAALQNRQARNNGYLHHPYNRPSPSPTSGPPASGREAYRSQSTSHLYNLHHDETTLALGIQTYLDQLIGVCNEMRTFVSRGFGEGDTGGDNERRVKVENFRLLTRKRNHNLTELNELITPMPPYNDPSTHHGYGENSGKTIRKQPRTGAEIRDMDHKTLNNLLDAFALPHDPNMFLHDKKLLWLRFVGAGRGLRFRVLG